MESFVFPEHVVSLSLPPYIKFPSIVNSGEMELFNYIKIQDSLALMMRTLATLCVSGKSFVLAQYQQNFIHLPLSVPKVRVRRKVFHQTNLSEELTEMHKNPNILQLRCQLNHIDGYKSVQRKIKLSLEMQDFEKKVINDGSLLGSIIFTISASANRDIIRLT